MCVAPAAMGGALPLTIMRGGAAASGRRRGGASAQWGRLGAVATRSGYGRRCAPTGRGDAGAV